MSPRSNTSTRLRNAPLFPPKTCPLWCLVCRRRDCDLTATSPMFEHIEQSDRAFIPTPTLTLEPDEDESKSIANELQYKYWDSFSGSYIDGELWTDAVRTMLVYSISRSQHLFHRTPWKIYKTSCSRRAVTHMRIMPTILTLDGLFWIL